MTPNQPAKAECGVCGQGELGGQVLRPSGLCEGQGREVLGHLCWPIGFIRRQINFSYLYNRKSLCSWDELPAQSGTLPTSFLLCGYVSKASSRVLEGGFLGL